jgi:hypothetical protein
VSRVEKTEFGHVATIFGKPVQFSVGSSKFSKDRSKNKNVLPRLKITYKKFNILAKMYVFNGVSRVEKTEFGHVATIFGKPVQFSVGSCKFSKDRRKNKNILPRLKITYKN